MKSVMLVKTDSKTLHLRSVARYLHLTKSFYPQSWYTEFLGLVRSGDYVAQLRKLDELPQTEYGDGMKYAIRAQLVAYYKKYDFSSDRNVLSSFSPDVTAWKKFLAAEHHCKRVNSRFRAFWIRARSSGFPSDRHQPYRNYLVLIQHMRRYIDYVLGSEPDMDRIYGLCDFGPGSAVGNPRSRGVNIGRKLLGQSFTSTPSCLSYAVSAIWRNPHLTELLLSKDGKVFSWDGPLLGAALRQKTVFVDHNNIAFVPKSYKTMRSIAAEPLLNGFVQRGVDKFMREKLLRVGLDLSDQSRNSDLAREGSITGLFSTIDLSSASDTLSIELARAVLPPSWFELMDAIRSPRYNYRGSSERYQKFVSMGNGFCFPLQTLIFKAAVFAVSRITGTRERSCVYGDDIIVCKNDSLYLLEFLRFLGFWPNPDKTFVVGPFRESCGTDWYSGLDIRPVYFDRVVSNVDAFISHNQTYKWFLSPLLEDHRALMRAVVPEEVRFMRPFHGNADGAFSVSRDLFMTSPYALWCKDTYSWSWKELVFSTRPDHLMDVPAPAWCKEFIEYVAIIRGSRSECPLASGLRPRASVKRKSYWGQEVS